MARERLPQYADHFFVANTWEWIPPLRFDFVRTELVYVPGEYEREYVQFLLRNYLQPGGLLLVANYIEDHPDPMHGLFPGNHPTAHIMERLAELGFQAAGYRDGYDPERGRKVRIAIVRPGADSSVRAGSRAGCGRS
jgi:hypothetical protein